MIKKAVTTVGVAALTLGVGAPMASAVGDDNTNVKNYGISEHIYNMDSDGYMSPQIGLIQNSLNEPCIALPGQADVQNLLLNIGIQDLLKDTQDQQCTENSTAVKGDSPFAELLEDVLSENGAPVAENEN
ncbi:rodlin [Streptomyces sp. TRM76323]|uniref:Rodlin n=1 Tax=Streptomyces tamarix TaxID=3078565 RepID=A0ABU3QE20_9ACTN|nr:rodlin [Streptomyces tamarix]MDT9680961.1 rodlin [Streptomyces tamarix]